jgi:hypothetical protein
MWPTEDDMHRLVELRVRKQVLEWLEAENDHYLDRIRAYNSGIDGWNELLEAYGSWVLPIEPFVELDGSFYEAHGELLDWLYAETLWELLHLEERVRVSFEFSPQRVILPVYDLEDEAFSQTTSTVLPYPCPEFGEE